MVTGKNKEQFEKWFRLNFHWTIEDAGDGTYFNALPFEMQIGVYLAYYDSLWMEIYIYRSDIDNKWRLTIYTNSGNLYFYGGETRNEAYKEAFKQADILINNK